MNNRRIAVLSLAFALVTPVGPLLAGEAATCGGSAPSTTSCAAQYTLESNRVGLSAGASGVFVGSVAVRATSHTGTKAFTCVVVSAALASHSTCTLDLEQGSFSRGQLVTVRGEAQGAGTWRVTAIST